MKNKYCLFIPVLVIAVMVIFLSGCGQQTVQTSSTKEDITKVSTIASTETEMVDCEQANDPECFINRMNQCLPVTTRMTGTDDSAIEITILGIVNETCHFQRKINNVLNLDCYFPKGTMNMDTLDQTFGNDKGLQKVVDDACMAVGW